MADSVRIEIINGVDDYPDGSGYAIEIAVKAGTGFATVAIDDVSFDAAQWPKVKAEVDRILSIAQAATGEHQPKEASHD